MGLSPISEVDGDFSQKSQNFPTVLYFAPALKGFLLELASVSEVKKLEWWGYRADKEVWRYL